MIPLTIPCLALWTLAAATPAIAQSPPLPPGIHGPTTTSQSLRHTVTLDQMQALTGHRLRDPQAAPLLQPELRRLLGTRYGDLMAALTDDLPLRREGTALVGEGVVPGTLGYRGAFIAFGPRGEMMAVIKGGRHGTTVERFGSLALLADPAVHHAYQEFLGLDE